MEITPVAHMVSQYSLSVRMGCYELEFLAMIRGQHLHYPFKFRCPHGQSVGELTIS